VYELRERPWLRCLLSPFETGFTSALFLGAVGLLFVGGWIAAGAGCYLLVFELMSYRIRLRADESGIEVTNRFFRHRIPWSLVEAIDAHDGPADLFVWIPTLQITPGSTMLGISVGATMGMRKARRREIARELVEIARERGSKVIGGSNAEVAAHLEADVRLGLDSPRLLARRPSRSSQKPSSQGRG
jgi:Bacterial PH domain